MDIDKYLKIMPTIDLYKDLFKPGMKKAGEALATVLDGANLILLPLKLINEKSKIYFEKNLQRYSDKVNSEGNFNIDSGAPVCRITYNRKTHVFRSK